MGLQPTFGAKSPSLGARGQDDQRFTARPVFVCEIDHPGVGGRWWSLTRNGRHARDARVIGPEYRYFPEVHQGAVKVEHGRTGTGLSSVSPVLLHPSRLRGSALERWCCPALVVKDDECPPRVTVHLFDVLDPVVHRHRVGREVPAEGDLPRREHDPMGDHPNAGLTRHVVVPLEMKPASRSERLVGQLINCALLSPHAPKSRGKMGRCAVDYQPALRPAAGPERLARALPADLLADPVELLGRGSRAREAGTKSFVPRFGANRICDIGLPNRMYPVLSAIRRTVAN